MLADALLYEGFLLYPGRNAGARNRAALPIGVVAPPAWAPEVPGASSPRGAEPFFQQSDLLIAVEREAGVVTLRLRFLQLQPRRVESRVASGSFHPVEGMEVEGRLFLGATEAVACEYETTLSLAALVDGPCRAPLDVAGAFCSEPVLDRAGRVRGRVVRSRSPLRAELTVSLAVLDPERSLHRLRVRCENTAVHHAPAPGREEVLAESLLATHTLYALEGARFVSLLDPPGWAEYAARGCRSVQTFPVLVGAIGAGDLALSAPIALSDYPQLTPGGLGAVPMRRPA